MMNTSDFSLRDITVIILSDESHEHDYSNIHHQFLVSKGVIPVDWDPEEFVISPSLSRIEYANGVHLLISDETLQISQTQELKFGEKYILPDIAVRYLTSMEPVAYTGCAMNWTILAPCDDSRKWIKEHFFRSKIISPSWENFSARTSIRFEMNSMELILDFAAIRLTPDDEAERDAVRIVCNVIHQDVSERDELKEIISNWPEYEGVMLTTLKSLMEVEQDD